MTTNSARRRPSLKDKISGPNALPIAKLVARGESASQRVQEEVGDFLHLRINQLEGLAAGLVGEEAGIAAWKEFYTIVHDIRGSCALAGKASASAFCVSLESLLQQRDPADPRMHVAIKSHINALNLVMSGRANDENSQHLLASQLSRAVECLPLKQRYLRTG